MPQHVIIDGNNLLHAMYVYAPIPPVGRETLVKVIERWALRGEGAITLVFDGPTPRAGLARQMASRRITVRFSAPATADDVIVDMIRDAKNPTALHIVTSDAAIRYEAAHRRCRHTGVADFIRALFPPPDKPRSTGTASREKPEEVSQDEARKWLDTFGADDAEPFDGHDAMIQ